MPAIVDFPTLVQEALTVFGAVFDTEAARRHCAESLPGLIVAANKTGSGINRAFALTTDPAGLHRWLTEGHGEVQALNDQRLAGRQPAPQTRDSARGVIAIANTLVTHAGTRIEDGGWCWDHADQRHGIAHAYGISTSVCPSGAPDPIEWRRVQKRDAGAAGALQDPTLLGMTLLDDAITRALPGDCTFESPLTSAQILNPIPSQQRAEVGALKLHRQVVYPGREQKRQDVARQMPWEAKKPVRMGSTR